MVAVNNQALIDKLHNLNSTQQSIETVSAWCSFYRRDARKVVAIWESEFVKMSMAKQLAMLYLANDILQNSRKKGPEFVHEFYKTLPRAVKHMLKHGDDKVKRAVNRMVDIWEDRKVFGNSGTRPFKEVAAEAETPKRSGSGIGQDAEPAVAAKFQPLEALANALQEAQSASDRSDALTQMVLHLDEGMVSTGTPSELLAASQLLKQYHSSLQSQLSRHQHAAHILQALMSEQEDSAQTVQQQLVGTQQQQQLVQERLSLSSSATQQPSSSPQVGNHSNAQQGMLQHDQSRGQDPGSSDQAPLDGPYSIAEGPAAQNSQQGQDAELDMDYEPPGKASVEPDDLFGPLGSAGGATNHVSEQALGGGQTESGHQGQGQNELYTPGLPADPADPYMADPSLQSNGAASAAGDPGRGVDAAYGAPEEAAPAPDPLAFLAALQGMSKEQREAIGLNLEASVFQQPPLPEPNDYLADQMMTSSAAGEEYDPEDLYDPAEGL